MPSNMSQDFAKLSYKELQALAVKHRIPGNIKKSLLVNLLRALKCGDEIQVTRMLVDLKENRKRKVRKRKLEKMTAVTSTPLHSPNYSSVEDRFYSPQHLSPPYHSTTSEEILGREDPHYEVFRHYLIHKIQKSYQNFDENNNDVVGMETSIGLNLKEGTLESSSPSNILTNTIMPSGSFAHHSCSQIESQASNDINNNHYKPMILQKMLQAPLGTNLGAMARLESSRPMWPTEHYYESRESGDNNSETITADSESIDEEWGERPDYYNLYDNRRMRNISDEEYQIPQFTLEQMVNCFQNNSQNEYELNNQFDYVPPNVQKNCQTWIENNSLDYRGSTEAIDPSRINSSYSVGGEQTSYQYHTDGSFSVFGQSNHDIENDGLQGQNNLHSNYHQFPAQQQVLSSYRSDFYDQTNSTNTCPDNIPFNSNVMQQFSVLQMQDSNHCDIYIQESTASAPYLEAGQNSIYHQNHYNNNQLTTNSIVSNFQQASYNSQIGGSNIHLRPASTITQRKGNNNFMDPYWPKWSSSDSGLFSLENILNLNTSGSTDYTKFNQTSTVYCFAPPLSSPMLGTSNSQQIERVELVTAGRHHTFTPNSLVYSDSTTGMRMAKLNNDALEEIESDESSITVACRSDVSHNGDPIEKIWIPDFNNLEKNYSNDFLSSSCETLPE